MHQLLLGVKLPGAAFPVAVGLIDDFRLLLAFIFVPFLLHQGGYFRLFLMGKGKEEKKSDNERRKRQKLDLHVFFLMQNFQ